MPSFHSTTYSVPHLHSISSVGPSPTITIDSNLYPVLCHLAPTPDNGVTDPDLQGGTESCFVPRKSRIVFVTEG